MKRIIRRILLVIIIFCFLFTAVSCRSNFTLKGVLRPEPTATGSSIQNDPSDTTNDLSAPPSPWDRYEPATIESIKAEFEEEASGIYIGGWSLYPYPVYQVKVINLDSCRKISKSRTFLLSKWSDSFMTEDKDLFISMYKHECLFSEGTDEYWMPIQEQLIPFLEDEVAEGEEATIYVRWIGVNRETAEIDWVFWISEFNL